MPILLTDTADRFKCLSCGECCKGWDVWLEKSAYCRIKEAMEKDPLPGGLSVDEAIILKGLPTDEWKYASIVKKGNRCIFLTEGNLCILHQQYGFETKGWICKAFPYHAYRTPSGLIVYPHFSCRGMIVSLRETAGDYGVLKPPLAYSQNADCWPLLSCSDDTPFIFYQDVMVKAEVFELVRQNLCQIIISNAISIEERLLMGRFFLEDLGKTSCNKLLEIDNARKTIQQILDDIGRLLEKVRSVSAHTALHIRTLEALINLRKRAENQEGENHTFEQIVTAFGFYKQSNHVLEQKFCALYRKHYLPAMEHLSPMLSTYLINRITSGPSLFQGGIVASYHTVILLYILVRLVVVAESAEKQVDETLLGEAIYIVEKAFCHNKRIFDFWQLETKSPHLLTPLFASLVLKLLP